MSSSSPRNANSRSKASPAESRKRTQEVETGDGKEGLPAGSPEAITPSPGATAAELATSALDAAAGEARVADEVPTTVGSAAADLAPEARPAEPAEEARTPEPREVESVESFVGSESSPLGREILGAAQDMEGEWSPEPPRPVPGAAPASALELLDETDLIAEAPGSSTSGLIVVSPSAPPTRDEEFLRRVVLPPLPTTAPSGSVPRQSYYEEDTQDKTVISDPPSPEMVASWGRPSRAGATARALQRRMKAPVALTTLELLGLLTGSALAGGLIGALFMSVPQAAADRQATPPALVASPDEPAAAAVAPAVPPIPPPLPTPRPTVESLNPPETLEPAEPPPTTQRARKSSRRSAARKATKKEWVDPFEQ